MRCLSKMLKSQLQYKRLSFLPNLDNRTKYIQRTTRYLKNNFFLVLFFLLFCLLLFVLFITNQSPSSNYDSSSDFAQFAESHHHHDHSDYHYGVVIDCGSSGSRVFLYYWPPHNGAANELLKIRQMTGEDGQPYRKKIKPGISSFRDSPQNASSSLLPLLRYAEKYIPRDKRKETPLFLMATAGMRLLPARNRRLIMKNIQESMPKMTGFYFAESHAEVISGKQEGIYLWIATNYILNRFEHTHSPNVRSRNAHRDVDRKRTVGTIEIGGASLQIAYEVPLNRTFNKDLSVRIDLGCDSHQTIHQYQIYVTTFLGYGTDAARRRYVNQLVQQRRDATAKKSTAAKIGKAEDLDIGIKDACLNTENISIEKTGNASVKLFGTGDFAACERSALPLLNKTVRCVHRPCSFNGVHQSPIDFKQAEFYGFAEFWYSSHDVWGMGGQYDYHKLQQAAKVFCARKWSIQRHHYGMGLYPKADNYRFKYQCFKAAWMTTVLHHGMDFPLDFTKLTTAQMIHGKEVQWTLGALLYRTRYMPLRDMNMGTVVHTSKAQHGIFLDFLLRPTGFYGFLGLCVLSIVGGAVWLYWRRLHMADFATAAKSVHDRTLEAPLFSVEYSM